MLSGETQTFYNTPRIPTTTDFTTINFDDGISTYNGKRHSTSQLSQRFGILLLIRWVREIVYLDLVLGNLVENLSKG